jgi:small subunit ribosomal protein S6
MRQYETMFVLHPGLDGDAINEWVTRFQGVVAQNGGTIMRLQEIGKRRLAYEIEGVREGYYVLLNFTGSTQLVGELGRVMKISEPVLRFLTVRPE